MNRKNQLNIFPRSLVIFILLCISPRGRVGGLITIKFESMVEVVGERDGGPLVKLSSVNEISVKLIKGTSKWEKWRN